MKSIRSRFSRRRFRNRARTRDFNQLEFYLLTYVVGQELIKLRRAEPRHTARRWLPGHHGYKEWYR